MLNTNKYPVGGIMFSNKTILKTLATFAVVTLTVSCSESETVMTETVQAKTSLAKSLPSMSAPSKSTLISLDVYKSPTCGCCKKWIEHIEDNGFQSKTHSIRDVSFIKSKKGIEPRYRSCHTAVSKEGYVFEGHVPAKYIQQFLSEKHDDNVIGLSVPAMPVGSPGMEVDDKFGPYRVLLLKSDGTNEIYANVQTYEQQF